MRINARIRRGLATIAAHVDAGDTGGDLCGFPDRWDEVLEGDELAEAQRKVEEVDDALVYLWHLANGGRKR
jgi:hypothetical protein